MVGRAGLASAVVVAALLVLGFGSGRASSSALPPGADPSRQRVSPDLSTGTLLVASRSVRGGSFLESVVLLIAHSQNGAAGLILNRRTETPLARVLPAIKEPKDSQAVAFFGGPVGLTEARALLRSSTTRKELYHVLADIYLLDSPEKLNDAFSHGAASDRLRVYVGYAGWGGGQLEREIFAGVWHVLDGEGAVVFDANPDTLWRRQIRRTEVLVADAAAHGHAGRLSALSMSIAR